MDIASQRIFAFNRDNYLRSSDFASAVCFLFFPLFIIIIIIIIITIIIIADEEEEEEVEGEGQCDIFFYNIRK